MGDTMGGRASNLGIGGNDEDNPVKNRGAVLSACAIAGLFFMGVQSLWENEGPLRLVRLALDGSFAAVWLAALVIFLKRPSLSRFPAYARFAADSGLAVVAFAFLYGGAACWFDTDYYIYAAFIVLGFVVSPIRPKTRWITEASGGLSLIGISLLSRGAGPGLGSLDDILLPLALSEVAARAVERMRLEGEMSMQDLRSRNEELEELAYRDPLTHLYNRRYGFDSLRKSIAFTRRYGGELHLLVLDIDHFKKVNDELGHPVGDTVLSGIGKILQGSVRESDIAARIGGEEFMVILTQAHPEHAQAAANRIRDITARTPFEAVPWRITVSIGVTSLRDKDTAESIFSRADGFLYNSKRSGRNRVSGS